jgi:hypothetical protein
VKHLAIVPLSLGLDLSGIQLVGASDLLLIAESCR